MPILTRRSAVIATGVGALVFIFSPKQWFKDRAPEALQTELDYNARMRRGDVPPRGYTDSSIRKGKSTQLDNTSGGDEVEDLNGRFVSGWVADASLTNTYVGKDKAHFVRMGVGEIVPGKRAKASIRVMAFLPEVSTGPKKVSISIDGVSYRSSKTAVSERTSHNGVEGILLAFQTKALTVEDGNEISASVELGGKTYKMDSYSYAGADFENKDPSFNMAGLNLS